MDLLKPLRTWYQALLLRNSGNHDSPDYWSPAAAFEELTGLRGIATEYRFPGEISDARFQAHMTSSYPLAGVASRLGAGLQRSFLKEWEERDNKVWLPELLKHWDAVVELNPTLERVRLDRTNIAAVWDCLLGTTSRFPPADINAYINRLPSFSDQVHQLTGHSPSWVVSDETYRHICQLAMPSAPGEEAGNAPAKNWERDVERRGFSAREQG